jgi:alkanesulfonate monooxygenase SsuD/methylene tetrahydromethanopterin reductase-like flavin-dependent oxidoreductase (luciferase family)
MFLMRFDLRAPAHGAPAADLYEAALDIAEWAEMRGTCLAMVLCEHHASPDGYLPTPLVMASAVAARTKQLPITIAATLLPLYEPVRLAEEMAVLDIVSRGRVSYVFGLGYRPEEFEHFGIAMSDRARIVERNLDLVLRALREESFEHEGRTITVTPRPFSPGGPGMAYGGSTAAAARRAARYGLDFLAQSNAPGIGDAYRAECARLGREPGGTILPHHDTPTVTFVADDVDKAWDEIGSYLLYDAMAYASWNPGDTNTANISHCTTVDALRAEQGPYRIVDAAGAQELLATYGILQLHPLCGGIPPELAWPYLERAHAAITGT